MKRLIKIINLISFGVSAGFIMMSVYIIFIQNKMIKDTTRVEIIQVDGVETIVKKRIKEINRLKYQLLVLELENMIWKQQVEESKHTLNNYRKYVIESIKVKNAVYSIE